MDTNQPTVSVIIPVFNGARYVLRAIESVEHQTLRDFEIIVVDDGSTDDTKAVLDLLAKAKKIQYFYQDNKGLSGARNAGIRLARGKYLKFLDHDDLLYAEQLERQVAQLRGKRDHVFSMSGYELEFESGNRKASRIKFEKVDQLSRFIEGNQCPVHAILVSRDVVERAGCFDEDLRACEDLDLWLRILLLGGECETVDYVGCCYRIVSGSMSSDSNELFCQEVKVYEKLNEALMPQLSELSDEIVRVLYWGNVKRAHSCFARKLNPAARMPTALKVNHTLFPKMASGLKQVVFTILGMQNVLWLRYLRASLKDRNYPASLVRTATAWREE